MPPHCGAGAILVLVPGWPRSLAGTMLQLRQANPVEVYSFGWLDDAEVQEYAEAQYRSDKLREIFLDLAIATGPSPRRRALGAA